MPMPFARVKVKNDSGDIVDFEVYSSDDGHTFAPEPTLLAAGVGPGEWRQMDVPPGDPGAVSDVRTVRAVMRRNGQDFGSFEVTCFDPYNPAGSPSAESCSTVFDRDGNEWSVDLELWDDVGNQLLGEAHFGGLC